MAAELLRKSGLQFDQQVYGGAVAVCILVRPRYHIRVRLQKGPEANARHPNINVISGFDVPRTCHAYLKSDSIVDLGYSRYCAAPAPNEISEREPKQSIRCHKNEYRGRNNDIDLEEGRSE